MERNVQWNEPNRTGNMESSRAMNSNSKDSFCFSCSVCVTERQGVDRCGLAGFLFLSSIVFPLLPSICLSPYTKFSACVHLYISSHLSVRTETWMRERAASGVAEHTRFVILYIYIRKIVEEDRRFGSFDCLGFFHFFFFVFWFVFSCFTLPFLVHSDSTACSNLVFQSLIASDSYSLFTIQSSFYTKILQLSYISPLSLVLLSLHKHTVCTIYSQNCLFIF